MNRGFVDTGGFYAALNRRDASHKDATRLFRRVRRDHWFLFTTTVVLAETHALILVRMGWDRAWNVRQAAEGGLPFAASRMISSMTRLRGRQHGWIASDSRQHFN
jgi:predicted nucleic acid-binding protein